jgi:tetratricopeptide (TPR) repeat protein
MRRTLTLTERATYALMAAVLLTPLMALPLQAGDTTRLEGVITDNGGKPLEKVEVWFENASIKQKRVGPVKSNKKGHYVHPFLDIGPDWRVIPSLSGYKVLKVSWRIVDSQRNDRGKSEALMDSKQEIPPVHPVPVGSDGVNEVNFVMVKDAEFNDALRQALAQRQGGAAPASGAPGTPAPAAPGTPAAPAPPGGAPAPAAAPSPAGAPAGGSGHNVSEALELMKAGKNEEAIPILQDYLEKNPNNGPLQFTLGKAFVMTKRYEEAVPALMKSLALKPDQAGAHFYLGIVHSSMGQDDEALKEFVAEIPISPNEDAAYSNAAALYEKQGKLDEALEYYKKAAEANPKRADLHASMAGIYEKKGNKTAAEAEYKALADIDPNNAAVTWYNIGALAKNNDRNEEAVRAFTKAVELDPNYAVAHRELGYALVKQGDFKGAAVHFNRYVALAPKASDAAEIRDMAKQLGQ